MSLICSSFHPLTPSASRFRSPPSTSSSSSDASTTSSSSYCRCATTHLFVPRPVKIKAGYRSSRCRAVRMGPEEEKLTRRNPLDFPIEWERPKPGRRPDIFPQFSPMKTPLPPPLPYDPPEEDEEDEEKKEEEEEDPEREESDKPEN
ncbi:hypothetical protein RJ640_024293, partial [Escallonia rubra]